MNRLDPLPGIMLAPNGARLQKSDHPAVPITIAETVRAARDAYRAGARALHAHVRDRDGQHSLDAGLYRELISEMRLAVPGMAVQITTEAAGRFQPNAQIEAVRATCPEGASVSVRELWRDPQFHPAVRDFYAYCDEATIAVQHILYGREDVDLLSELHMRGDIPAPRQAILVFGRYLPPRPARPQELAPLVARCREVFPLIDLAVCAFGANELRCLAEAARQGCKVRIGFENNHRTADGQPLTSNADSVQRLVKLLDQEGLAPKRVQDA